MGAHKAQKSVTSFRFMTPIAFGHKHGISLFWTRGVLSVLPDAFVRHLACSFKIEHILRQSLLTEQRSCTSPADR
jgi:hypothetical protein